MIEDNQMESFPGVRLRIIKTNEFYGDT